MTFIQAITRAFEGKKVRRTRWGTAFVTAAPNTNVGKYEYLHIQGSFGAAKVNDGRLHPWSISAKDFKATDWEVVE